ncbi:unnamed protein product [Arctogadus glacialis]
MRQLTSDAFGSSVNMRCQTIFVFVLQLLFERCWSLKFHAAAGSTLVLPCFPSERGIDHLPILWKHNGKGIVPSPNFKFEQNSMFLSVSKITPASEGVYECFAREENIVWMNTHTITVEKLTAYTLKINEGWDINLMCMSPAHLQSDTYAQWYKVSPDGNTSLLWPGDGMAEGSANRVEWVFGSPGNSDQSITIKSPVVGDSGLYRCESINGSIFSVIQLIVEVAPTAAPHSCAGFFSAWEPCLDTDNRSGRAILKESLAEFSTSLYHHLQQLSPSGNLLYSPISIGSLLTHLLLGARGATRGKLEDALRLPREFPCVHLQMGRMRNVLNGSVNMASQIFHNPNLTLTKSFLDQTRKFYSSQPAPLLADGLANARMINSWVSEHTQNTITHLLDTLEPDTQLLLLNAVAFRGRWKTKFESGNRTAVFTKLNGDTETVPVLYSSQHSASNKYIPELKAQVMLFPLTGQTSLYILLPKTHSLSDLQQLEEGLSDRTLALMMEALRSSPPELIEVTLPKIRLDLQTDMSALLRKLDLSELFEGPNLCGLHAEGPVLLDGARHQAFLALTEEGVEAGAATATIFSRSFPAFSATRPFVLLLWSDKANMPLFMGRVTQP